MSAPVIRPKTPNYAQGAAYLAGLAVGFWKDLDEISFPLEREHRFIAQMPGDQVRLIRIKWAKAIECAQLWERM